MDISLLNKLVGQKIKEFRDFKHLSQADLAAKIGVNRSTISQIEAGNQQITISIIYAIAYKLDTDINAFLPPVQSIEIKDSMVSTLLQKEVEDDNINEATKNSILDLLKKPNDDK